MKLSLVLARGLCACLGLSAQTTSSWLDTFSYQRFFSDNPVTVGATATVDSSTCSATINGVDTRQPTRPFTFVWGDGSSTTGFFPQTHRYADCSRNFTAEVKPDYGNGPQDGAIVRVRFLPPIYSVNPVIDTAATPVEFPQSYSPLATRLYTSPTGLAPVTRLPGVSLDVASYALSVAASIQKELVNENVFPRNTAFRQIVYQSAALQGGLYSLWFTDPPAFVVTANLSAVPWSSFLHEMGHNVTLNSPADFYFGGRIDGNANALLSETLAQIFQHATIHAMAHRYRSLGLSEDLMTDIADDGLATCAVLASGYASYLNGGRRFSSWNDPQTPQDETLSSFMTLAYIFLREANTADPDGYRFPVKRLMEFLQLWNPAWQSSYSQQSNSPAAEAFRSTMLVAAISHGLQTDMRGVFNQLRFPLDENAWNTMHGTTVDTRPSPTIVTVSAAGGQFRVEIRPTDNTLSWTARANQPWVRLEAGSARRGSATLVFSVNPNPSSLSRTASITIGRQLVDIRQDAASTPAIGGVVHGASFQPGIVPGSWVTIFGAGLSSTTRFWRSEDIVDGQLPTTLDDVRVTIGGKPAFLYFISPTQINLQAPDRLSGASVPVQVIRAGQASPVVMVELKTLSPALFSYQVGTLTFPAAVHLDGAVVGDPNLLPGTRRASSRAVLLLFGTGFEPSPAGALISSPIPVSAPVRVFIGDAEALVVYAGLVSPGMFQVNIMLADLRPGNYSLVVEVGGVRSPPGLVLPVE